ncbi:MAG TPA: hypothetical protein VIC33_06765 [Vicinamibacterales bacterium]|jgi:hypothetical protein
MRSKNLSLLLAGAMMTVSLAVAPAFAAAKTFTGEVSDAMCGAHHDMGGDAASCTRDCVKGGSDYALVVDQKVYTLKVKDTKLKASLDKLAGAKATVTGEESGDTITVTAVKAAK